MLIELLEKFSTIIGVIGVILLLSAFYLLNTGNIRATSIRYQLLNCFGATFILFSLFFDWNLSAALIEIAWILISLLGIYKAYQAKNEENDV